MIWRNTDGAQADDPAASWMFGMHHYKDSSCICWPVSLEEVETEDHSASFIVFQPLKEPLYVPVVSWDGIECVVVEWRSWAWQVCNMDMDETHAPGIRGFADVGAKMLVKEILANNAFLPDGAQ